MCWHACYMKFTVSLEDDSLYVFLKIEAARSGRTVKELVEVAIKEWVERLEDEEDAREVAKSVAEYEREGGVEFGEFLRTMAAEVRAAYGADES